MKAQKVKRLFAALIHFYKCFDAAAGGGLNCKPRFRFARVSSGLAEFAKESAENEG
jgi:hypothetical protein